MACQIKNHGSQLTLSDKNFRQQWTIRRAEPSSSALLCLVEGVFGMITAYLAINEEQAKTVRLIFGLFIEGLTPCACPALAHPCASVAEFDSQLWASMVECVTVEVNSSMTVVFRDGTERRL